jgi:hypothetical protein
MCIGLESTSVAGGRTVNGGSQTGYQYGVLFFLYHLYSFHISTLLQNQEEKD